MPFHYIVPSPSTALQILVLRSAMQQLLHKVQYRCNETHQCHSAYAHQKDFAQFQPF